MIQVVYLSDVLEAYEEYSAHGDYEDADPE